jgi:hypothetical protein
MTVIIFMNSFDENEKPVVMVQIIPIGGKERQFYIENDEKDVYIDRSDNVIFLKRNLGEMNRPLLFRAPSDKTIVLY